MNNQVHAKKVSSSRKAVSAVGAARVVTMAASEMWSYKRKNQRRDIAGLKSGELSHDDVNWFTGGLARKAKVIGSMFWVTNGGKYSPAPTEPLISDINEVPLAPAEFDRLLANMQPDMVLVGGQAIAFWLSKFELDTAGMPVSQDGDVLGTLEQARATASALNATLVVPRR